MCTERITIVIFRGFRITGMISLRILDEGYYEEYDALEFSVSLLTIPKLTALVLEQSPSTHSFSCAAPRKRFRVLGSYLEHSECRVILTSRFKVNDEKMVTLLLRVPSLNVPSTLLDHHPISKSA
ncbi:hypothetical protein GYMLUDRAFT_888524 [Collybiopsis luxurians FD-317 M1]|uniref:Uncharacterized protein n=1 Tax=Collybiopsis luxurians FD-317 M1 TaxID=944289 RepID=A0A0D0AWX5_9AGAR|nr:hypothetical protein GYMLUDRAFT_888524 [Collybiopsis luxurians FD-317 M1]